jgi:hypothetical protein
VRESYKKDFSFFKMWVGDMVIPQAAWPNEPESFKAFFEDRLASSNGN